MNTTIQELRVSDVIFSNEHDLSQESYSIELSMSNATTKPFLLWVNGELQGVYSTLSTLNKVANRIIERHDLIKV